MLVIALAAAAISWWFRFDATHRAAKFWGPDGVRLIRDAPVFILDTCQSADRDVSSFRGLIHLRTALLEDRSFRWPPQRVPTEFPWEHGLVFRDEVTGHSLSVFFSSDFRWVRGPGFETMLSCEPIAAGLREMYVEFEKRTAGR